MAETYDHSPEGMVDLGDDGEFVRTEDYDEALRLLKEYRWLVASSEHGLVALTEHQQAVNRYLEKHLVGEN